MTRAPHPERYVRGRRKNDKGDEWFSYPGDRGE